MFRGVSPDFSELMDGLHLREQYLRSVQRVVPVTVAATWHLVQSPRVSVTIPPAESIVQDVITTPVLAGAHH